MKTKKVAIFLCVLLMITISTSFVEADRVKILKNEALEHPSVSLPITDKPCGNDDWSEIAQLIASDGRPDDIFGTAVSISGYTAVIGAPDDNNYRGSAYIYAWNGEAWMEETKLAVTDNISADEFGKSVSIDGNNAIIGAPGCNGSKGAAYIFIRTGSTWTKEAKLTVSDGEILDYFGASVSISGNIAVVGTPEKNNNTGIAYVFTRIGTTWTQEATLTAPEGAPNDAFGWRISIDKSSIIIGAYGENSNRGAAYVFTRSGTTWIREARLTAQDSAPNNYFGISVSISGNTTLVGAPWNNNVTGAAYVFTRTGTTWVQEAKLTASDPTPVTGFSWSVCIDNNYAVIGAPWDYGSTGAAYIFKRTQNTWAEETILRASDGNHDDFFGNSVSISKTTVIIGSPNHDELKGAAYIFRKPIPEFLANITGPGITLSITNIGDADATNVSVKINLDGGLIFLGKEKTATIHTLAIGETNEVSLGFVLGIGKTTIIGAVTCDEGISAERSVSAFILLFFILGLK